MQEIDLNNKTILVTGGAGFIGSNLINLVRDTQLEFASKKGIPYRAIWTVERNHLDKTIGVYDYLPHQCFYL